jgi:hypothetical protein
MRPRKYTIRSNTHKIGGVEFDLPKINPKQVPVANLCDLAQAIISQSVDILTGRKVDNREFCLASEKRWWQELDDDDVWLQLLEIHPDRARRIKVDDLIDARDRIKAREISYGT